MTPVEQYLGRVRRNGKWRIRWVRVDPYTASGILVSVHEVDLACEIKPAESAEHPELDPAWPLPDPMTIRSERDAPVGQVAGSAENAALLRAEQATGARRDRWVNTSVSGWSELNRLRGDAGPDEAAPFPPADADESVEELDVPEQDDPEPVVEEEPVEQEPADEAYYKNCTEARAAGAAPLRKGEPGYRSALDRDDDGEACETD
ncbi:excalibur calcium-binding domain-containing protein [Asanoa hainanensis]|uniref:excalibur calcium-binding domain-containing protein n=1 Tax=Asanoa hainanensis TaxID=560556 RepID=UPI001FE95F3A|nr:excalibur calcium-binding domain-containing protein [Asanoa hainanensis]